MNPEINLVVNATAILTLSSFLIWCKDICFLDQQGVDNWV